MARERLRYIEDGYTEDGFVRRRPGMWDQDLRFLYRPMTRGQQQMLAQKCFKRREKGGDASVLDELNFQAQAVAKCLCEWDYKRPDGKEIPVSGESLLRMKPMLFAAVCAIVCGYEPSDPDEDAPHRTATRDDADLQEVFGGGANAVEDFDAKNSETG